MMRMRTSVLMCVIVCAACQGELDHSEGGDAPDAAEMSMAPDLAPTDMNAPDAAPDLDAASDLADLADPPDQPTPDMDAPDMMEPQGFTATRSGVFLKRSCGDGCVGTPHRYTATQRSMASEADAARLAHLDVMANGQRVAEESGGCECAPAACACEDFRNHGAGSPHLYSSAYSGMLVGEVLAACRPTYWVEGLMAAPAPMMEVGRVEGTDKKLYRYEHRDDGSQRNTHIRSPGEGCMDYPDIRTQHVPGMHETLTEWSELPALPALPVDGGLDIPLVFSTELEGMNPGSAAVWSVMTTPQVPGLVGRTNGGDWQGAMQQTWGYFFHRPTFEVSELPYSAPPKDFILDISRDGGASGQRFIVYRTTQGGHYSAITTATRQDGRVFVTAQLANAEVQQRLIHSQTGQVYPSHPIYGMTFDLGQLPEGDHLFSLWTSDDTLIDAHVTVKVRRPQ